MEERVNFADGGFLTASTPKGDVHPQWGTSPMVQEMLKRGPAGMGIEVKKGYGLWYSIAGVSAEGNILFIGEAWGIEEAIKTAHANQLKPLIDPTDQQTTQQTASSEPTPSHQRTSPGTSPETPA